MKANILIDGWGIDIINEKRKATGAMVNDTLRTVLKNST
jgi:hypothetical protein